jgi:hypothetical protein
MFCFALVYYAGQSATITSTTSGGNWNDAATWVGGVVPLSTDDVVIATTIGNQVTLTAPATCNGLTINSDATLVAGVHLLTINGDFVRIGTFTSGTGGVTLSGTADQLISGFTTTGNLTMSKTGGIATLAGDINAVQLIINGAGGTLNLGLSRTHTFTGVIQLTAGTLQGSSSTLNANFNGSAWAGTGSVFVAGTSTVVLGGAAQTISTTTTFYNLTFAGTGGKTLAAATTTTVNGTFTIANGTNANTYTGALVYGANAGLRYSVGANNRTTNNTEWPTPFVALGGVTIDGAAPGAITLNAAKQIGNNTNVPLVINTGGTLTLGSHTLTLHGDFINTATLNAGANAITISGTVANQNIAGFNSTGNVTVNKASGTVNFTGGLNTGSLTVSGAAAVVNLGSHTHTFSGTVNVSGGTLNAGNANISLNHLPTGAGVLNGNAANFTFTGGGTITIRGFSTTGNIVFNRSNSNELTIGGDITANNLTVTGGNTRVILGTNRNHTFTGTLQRSSGQLSLGTNTTINLTGNGLVLNSNTNNATDFNAQTSTIVLAGDNQSIGTTDGVVYNNLTFAGNGSKTISNNITVNGTLTIANGTHANTWTGAVTYNTSSTLVYDAGSANRTASNEWVGTFPGAGGVIIRGTGTITLNADKIIGNGSAFSQLVIDPGATLATNNFALTFAADFINNGSLVAGSSSFTISGGRATQSINGFTTTGNVSMIKTVGTATLTGAVSAAALTINGSGGTLNMGNALSHSFSGQWTRTAGTLNLNSSEISFSFNGTVVSGTGGNFVPGTGTVIFSGAAQTCPVFTYHNLTLANTGTKTFATSPTVNGTLQLNGSADVVVTSGTVTYGSLATLRYNRTTAYTTTLAEFPATFSGAGGVVVSGAGVITFDANKVITYKLNIHTGSQVNLGTGLTHTCRGLIRGGSAPAAGQFGATPSGAAIIDDVFFGSSTGILNSSSPLATWKIAPINSDWHNINNWEEAIIPDAFTDAIIPTGSSIYPVLTAAATTKNLEINTGATVSTAGFQLSIHGDLINAGTLSLGASNVVIAGVLNQNIAALSTTGTITSTKTGGTATLTGALSSNGLTINGSGGTLNLGTSLTHTINGNITVTAGTLNGGTATISINGDISGTGTFTGNGFNLTLTGSADQNIRGFTTTGNVSNLKSGGNASLTGNVSANNLVMNGSGSSLLLGAALTHTFSGTITLTAGTLNGGSSTLNVNGTSATAWSGVGSNFTSATSTVVFGGNAQTIATTTQFFNIRFAGNGVKTIAAGVTVTVDNLLTVANQANAITVSGTLTYGPSSGLVYAPGANRSVGTEWPTSAPFGGSQGVTIQSNTITLAANRALSAGIPFTTVSGATFALANFDITVRGDVINNGTISGSGTTSRIVCLGTVTQNFSGNAISISGNFDVEKPAGTVFINQNITCRDFNVFATATVDLGTGRTYNISRNFNNLGTVVFNNSNFTFSGTTSGNISAITTTGNISMTKTAGTATLVGNVTANNLTLNGGGGTLHLGVAHNHTFSGTWAQTAGTLDGGSSTITFTSATAPTGTSAFVANTSTVIYAGAAQTVRPVTYYNLVLGGSGVKTVTASVVVNNEFTLEGTATVSAPFTYGGDATLRYNKSGSFTTTNNEFPPSFSPKGGVIVAGTGPIIFNGNKTIVAPLQIETGATVDLGTFTGHSSEGLILGGVPQAAGTYGHSSSAAANTDDVFFENNTGIIDVTNPNAVWLGNTANWHTATNWSNGFVPNLSSNVTINSGTPFQPTLGAAAFCGNLTISTGASLTTNGFDLNLFGNLTNNGTLTLGSSHVILNGNSAQVIPSLTTTGNLSMLKPAGVASITGSLNVSGITLNGAAGTLDLGTALTHTLTGNLINTAGTLVVNNCNIILTGSADQSIVGFTSTTTLTCNKSAGTATFTSAGDFNNIEVTGAGGTLSFGTTSLTHIIRGNLTLTAGAIAGGNSNITITGTNTQSIAGFTTTGNITMTKTGGTATFVGNMGFTTLTLNGTGGTLNLGAANTHTIGGNITVSAGTLQGSSANIIANGTGNQTIPSISTTGNLTCAKTAGTLTLTGTQTYNNILVTTAGGTLNFGSSNITISGNITRTAGTLSGGSGSITLAGTGNSIIDGFSNTGTITLTKTAGGTASFNGNMTMANLTLNGIGGILELGDGFNHTITGTLTRNNGTIDCGNSILTFTAAGTVITGSSGSFLPSNSTIIFNNAGAQTLAPLTYQNVTLAGGGTKTTSGVTINGVLRLQGTATVSDPITYGDDATIEYNKSAAFTTTDNEFPAVFDGNGGVVIAGAGTITFNNQKIISATLTINTGSTVNLNNITTHTTNGLIFGTSAQTTLGTYGVTGSGAAIINDTYFTGTGGRILLSSTVTTWLGSTFVWEDNSNWSNGIPTSTKDVILSNPPIVQPILAGPATVRDLTINSGASLNTSGFQIALFGNMINNGTLNLGSSNIIITGTSDQLIDGFSTTGNLSMTKLGGTATFTGDVNVNGIIINGTGGTLDLGAGHTHQLSGNLTLVAGALVGNSSNVNLTGSANQSIAGFTTTGAVTSLKSGGTATFTGDIHTSALTVNGSGGTIDLGVGHTHTVTGDLTITAGTLNGGSSLLRLQEDILGSGTFTANGMNLELIGTGTQSIRGFTTTGNISMLKTGGIATFTGNITANQIIINGIGGTLNMGSSLTHQINGDVVLTEGVLNGASATINVSSNTSTAWTGDGSLFTPATSTVVFSGADQTINTSTTFNNLILSGTGAKTFASGTTTTINGTHTIANGTHVNDFTGATIAYGAAGAIRYNVGANSRTVSAEWPATFTSTGGITIDGSAGGIITLNEAKVIGASNNTHLIINSGATLNTNNHAITLHGNLTRTGTLTAGSSNFTFAGTNATQTIAAFTTTGNISMTKTAGTATLNGNVSAGQLSINGAGGTLSLGTGRTHNFAGNVSLTAGTLNANNSTLIISASGANVWSGTGSIFNAGTGSVSFTGVSAQIATPTTFNNLLFEGSGTAIVSNNLTIRGFLEQNHAVDYVTNATTITLNGTAAQSILGSAAPDFYNLILDNPSGFSINVNDITVNNELNLESGLVNPTTGNILRLRGNFVRNTGELELLDSRLIMNGTTAQTIPANAFHLNEVFELEINNSAGVTLSSTTRLTNSLIPVAGTLQTGGHLVLVSNQFNTAKILEGSGTYITGNVTAERFIPSTAGRRWRFLGSPVSGTTFNDWRGEMFVTGPGTGTTVGTLNSNGFDASPNNSQTVFWYNEPVSGNKDLGWAGPTHISNTIQTGRGYRVFIRGDRSNLAFISNSAPPPNDVTLNLIGPVHTGNISMPVSFTSTSIIEDDGWNLLSNPYPCPISWKSFHDNGRLIGDSLNGTDYSNIEPSIWIYDPISNSYVIYNPILDEGTGPLTDGVIASGQSFWVKSTDPGTSMTMREQYKTANLPNSVFKTTPNSSFKIKLTRDEFNSDEVLIKYVQGSSVGKDLMDGLKIPTAVSISTYGPDNILLGLSARPTQMTDNDTVRLAVSGSVGSYTMEIINSRKLAVQDQLFLVDQFTSQMVNLHTTATYTFNITTNAASQGMNRFYIVVANNAPVPVDLIHFDAVLGEDKKVNINWTSASEINTSHFEVERSTNGKNYTTIATVNATGSPSVLTSYTVADNSPKAINYYRLRMVDNDGTYKYSQVRMVRLDGQLAGHAVQMYPVPVANQLTINHTQAGIRQVRVLGIWGQLLHTQQAELSQTAQVDMSRYAAGVYIIETTDENGIITREQLVKE